MSGHVGNSEAKYYMGSFMFILSQKGDNLFNIFVRLLRIIKQWGHSLVAEPSELSNKLEVSLTIYTV